MGETTGRLCPSSSFAQEAWRRTDVSHAHGVELNSKDVNPSLLGTGCMCMTTIKLIVESGVIGCKNMIIRRIRMRMRMRMTCQRAL
jgi:hypothetical protein